MSPPVAEPIEAHSLTAISAPITIDGAMKTVQINLDEALLAELDADAEVARDGRSAVLRRAARAYLARRRRATMLDLAYSGGYRTGPAEPLGPGFEGWEEQGVWPE